MNDADVIKAEELLKKLEEAYNAYYDTSKSMPYDIDKTIRETAICLENAITEINRQKGEIEKLEADNDKLAEDWSNLTIEKDQLFDEAQALIKKSKAEAITELIDKAKKHAFPDDFYAEGCVYIADLDQIAKEMKGGGSDA